MQHEAPHPPQETDDLKAPVKAKRPWSKPVVRRMSYIDVTISGPHVQNPFTEERTKYRPSSRTGVVTAPGDGASYPPAAP